MNINASITYVTCIYDDLHETEFGGRATGIWRRYYFGLESATKLGAPIVIFTWPKNVHKIETYYKNFLGHDRFVRQIKVLPFDLYQSPMYERIKSIKTYDQGYNNDRSFDVTTAKFLFIQDVIHNNYFNSEYVFWIDAGLSNIAIFPEKFLDKSDSERQYSECSLFTEKVVNQSIIRCKDSVLLLKCNTLGHHLPSEYVNHDTLNGNNIWYIIGGYFGGKLTAMYEFSNTILSEFVHHITEHNLLLLEEVVMTLHVSHNVSKYVFEEFDVWHHENSGDWVQPYIIGKKSFYRIFEEFNL